MPASDEVPWVTNGLLLGPDHLRTCWSCILYFRTVVHQVTFLPVSHGDSGLTAANYILNTIFILDIVVNFRTWIESRAWQGDMLRGA